MKFLLKKLAFFFLLMVGVSVTAFIFSNYALNHAHNTVHSQTFWNESLQYFRFILELFQGHFGVVRHDGSAVLETFLLKLPASLELIIPAILLAWVLGTFLAINAILRPGGHVDSMTQILGDAMNSIPVFWLGLILLMIFATGLELFPVSGRLDYIYEIKPVTGFMLIDTLLSSKSYSGEAFFNALNHLILPVMTLTIIPLSYVNLQLRNGMKEIHSSAYIRAARSRGMSRSRLIWRHSFPNAIKPVLDGMSLQFSVLITSTIIIEYLFSWPGIGHWFLLLIKQQDFLALRGVVILIAVIILIANIATDLLNYLTNPKLRRE